MRIHSRFQAQGERETMKRSEELITKFFEMLRGKWTDEAEDEARQTKGVSLSQVLLLPVSGQ